MTTQNVIMNGTIYVSGDLVFKIVASHPSFEHIYTYYNDKMRVAFCDLKLKNLPLIRAKFSVEDAKKAAIWGKPGPWRDKPEQMLTARAKEAALKNALVKLDIKLKTESIE